MDHEAGFSVGVRIFGFLQGVVALVILGTLYMRYRRDREKEEALRIKFEKELAMSRAAQHGKASGASGRAPHSANTGKAPHVANTPKVDSALPSWNKDTPDHVVLGIAPGASHKGVENAYRRLMKQYHPDRFASWGGDYQKRAHEIVLRIQEARARMKR